MNSNYTLHPLQFDPLHKEENKTALQTLLYILKSCIGAHGKLKILHNLSGGNAIVTSSSQRLFQNISVKNAFSKFIVSAIKSQLESCNDNGLYCGLMLLLLLNNALDLTYPLHLTSKLYEYFGKIYVNSLQLDVNDSVIKLNFSNLLSLQSLILPILKSKPACLFTSEDINYLGVLLLKIFLNNIQNSICIQYNLNVNYFTLEGDSPSKSNLYEGLLLRYPENAKNNFSDYLFMKQQKNTFIKIAIFTSSLSGDAEFPVTTMEISGFSLWNEILKHLLKLGENLLNDNVDIIACQKVVHPTVKKLFEDSDILVLDRLGSEVTKNLLYVTGCHPISSLTSDFNYGSLSSLKKLTLDGKDFLLACSNEKPFWTLLLYNINEEALNESKVVCQQAMNALLGILKQPQVCFGAGCTEIKTKTLVEKKVKENINDISKELGCTKIQIMQTLHFFLKSIDELAVALHQDKLLHYVSDDLHHHLWKIKDEEFPKENDECMCGAFKNIPKDSLRWKFLLQPFNYSLDVPNVTFHANNKEFDKLIIFDDLNSKLNASILAFETVTLLLRVSLTIIAE